MRRNCAVPVFLLLAMLASAVRAREYRIVDVVGDSISAGYNPDYSRTMATTGWVHFLYGQAAWTNASGSGTITNLWPGIQMYNSARSGSKAWEWAADANGWLSGVLNHQPDLVFVYIGGNDLISYYTSEGTFTEARQAEYRANLTAIVNALQSNQPPAEIVLLEYYDLFDGYSSNLSFPYTAYTNGSEAMVELNQIIRDVASGKGCHLAAGVYDAFMHHCYGEGLGDTGHVMPDYVLMPIANFDIHPVTAGHDAIYDVAWQELIELKDIPKFTGTCVESNRFIFTWSSGIAQDYVIQRATNLAGANVFFPLATNPATPPFNTYTDIVDGVKMGFYRVTTTN